MHSILAHPCFERICTSVERWKQRKCEKTLFLKKVEHSTVSLKRQFSLVFLSVVSLLWFAHQGLEGHIAQKIELELHSAFLLLPLARSYFDGSIVIVVWYSGQSAHRKKNFQGYQIPNYILKCLPNGLYEILYFHYILLFYENKVAVEYIVMIFKIAVDWKVC